MTSLVVAAVRLAAVIAALIWLPGWFASRRPLRPVRLLHSFTWGIAIYMLALVASSFVSQSVDRVVWLVPVWCLAIALLARIIGQRFEPVAALDPPALKFTSVMAVAGLVALAAALRWTHNYHFDDLQHLFYLTEIQREGVLFPSQFLLELKQLSVPGSGDGSLMLSRYPYWAVSHVLLSRLARVPVGDGYYLLGLALLAYTLGQMSALVSRAWSARTGVFWVVTVIAASSFVSDNLLNFGGYPFQSGKLFVLLALTAAAAAWQTREPRYLGSAGLGIFAGPLLHTNNAIGAAGVVLLLLPMIFLGRMRRSAVAATGVVLLLTVVALGSVGTAGFIRWVPSDRLVATATVPSDSGSDSRVETASPAPSAQTPESPSRPPDPVARRFWLFLSRGLPLEIVMLLAAAAFAPSFSTYTRHGERLAPVALLVGAALVCGSAASQGARQLVTSTMKPGYLSMRASLRALTPAIDPAVPLVTDPITAVLGRAAGWRVPGAPMLAIEDQPMLVLLHHPAVTGQVLEALLASVGPATLVINEQVVGSGVAQKFSDSPSLRVLARSGSAVDSIESVQGSVSAAVRSVYELDYMNLPATALASASAMGRMLLARPMVVFAHAEPARALPMGTLGGLLRRGSEPQSMVAHPFLNSALVTLPAPSSCVDAVELTVRQRTTFSSSLMVSPLDPVPGAASGAKPGEVTPADVSAVPLRFERPVCERAPLTVLVHSNYWWDFRFDVVAADWKSSSAVE